MASEISGLDPLHGYLKHGNYVVRLRVPYLQLEARHEKFIERKLEQHMRVMVGPMPPKQERVAVQQEHRACLCRPLVEVSDGASINT